MPDDPAEPGFIASLKRMFATLIAIAYTRLELVSVEIEEQIAHAAALLLWSVAAVFFAALTVLLLAFTIVIAFWDQHRLLAAMAVTGSFALLSIIAGLVVRTRLKTRRRLLSATTEELRRDAEALRGEPR